MFNVPGPRSETPSPPLFGYQPVFFQQFEGLANGPLAHAVKLVKLLHRRHSLPGRQFHEVDVIL